MKLGLHLSNFTYGVPTAELAAKLTEIVVGGEAAGFDRLSVMDHYFQIPHVGPVESEMFEAYSILGYIAAKTSRLKLGVLATGVTYRNPGFLAKQVAGLDVLSAVGPGSGSAPRGSSASTRAWALPFLRSRSASRCWKKPSRSARRCGATTTAPSRASTIS